MPAAGVIQRCGQSLPTIFGGPTIRFSPFCIPFSFPSCCSYLCLSSPVLQSSKSSSFSPEFVTHHLGALRSHSHLHSSMPPQTHFWSCELKMRVFEVAKKGEELQDASFLSLDSVVQWDFRQYNIHCFIPLLLFHLVPLLSPPFLLPLLLLLILFLTI
jgi:hypothetical protein